MKGLSNGIIYVNFNGVVNRGSNGSINGSINGRVNLVVMSC